MSIPPLDAPIQGAKTPTIKETTDVGTDHRVKAERVPVHPQLKVIFERIIQLQQTEERKLLIPLAIKSAVQPIYITLGHGDYTSAKFEDMKITLTKNYSAEQDLSQYAAIIALLGMRDGIDAIRQLRKAPQVVGSNAFAQFGDVIRMNEQELLDSGNGAKAVVYAFKFSGGTFGARNATQTLSGVLSDSRTFGGLDLTILQYRRDGEVVYQIFEAKTGDHGLQSNRFGRGDDPDGGRSYYSRDELQEILNGLQKIAGAHTWTEEEQEVWANLTGERIPEWLGQETPQWIDDQQGFRFNHPTAWIDLDNQQLRSLEDERCLIEKISYVEADAISGGWGANYACDLPPWPAPLTRLAEKSDGVAANVFRKLQELLSRPKEQIMARAALYNVTKTKPLNKKYSVVASTAALLTNCRALAIALETFFRSDLNASPETSLDIRDFGYEIESTIDNGEKKLLKYKPEEGKAKLYSMSIKKRQMTTKDGKGQPQLFPGHRFEILQYLGPEGKVRYLVLDAYQGQRQGLERLARRSEEDPSWSREEFESFLQDLRKIADATKWTPKHARRYHRAFGARHPELLGKPVSSDGEPLGMSAEVYPVDLKEVLARNSMESGKLAGGGVIQKIESLADEEFFNRRTKEMPGTFAGWWVTPAKDDADENA